jgi:multicomponent Na+:H+ antiporter subunit G
VNAILYVIIFLYAAGLFFNVATVVGIIRLPDVYCRLHSSSKNTTLGSVLIILGLALRYITAGATFTAVKLLLIGGIIMIVTPIGSNALAHSAYKRGVPLWKGSVCDQYAEQQKSFKKKGTYPE